MNGIAQTVARASSCTEDFRGDYDALAAMMQASWEQVGAPPFLYTPQFLADCFRYPGSGFALAPTIYHGSEPVAFVAGYPRRVMIGGVQRRILISTFLTVAAELKSSGYGIVVWRELIRRAQEAGFDGVVSYCVDGGAMHRMIHGICHWLKLPLARAASFSYLGKPIWRPAGDGQNARPDSSAPQLCRAAADMPKRAGISRLWAEDEAMWQLSRLGAVSVAAGSESCPAVLTGYVTTVADAIRSRCLVIEDVLWGDLAAPDQMALLGDLIAKAAGAGARIATLAALGYADPRPFVASGFVPTPHTTHSYLTMWSHPTPVGSADRYYLDVL